MLASYDPSTWTFLTYPTQYLVVAIGKISAERTRSASWIPAWFWAMGEQRRLKDPRDRIPAHLMLHREDRMRNASVCGWKNAVCDHEAFAALRKKEGRKGTSDRLHRRRVDCPSIGHRPNRLHPDPAEDPRVVAPEDRQEVSEKAHRVSALIAVPRLLSALRTSAPLISGSIQSSTLPVPDQGRGSSDA